MILELNNYYFVQVFFRKIVSISYISLDGFKIIIEDKYYSFYNKDVHYRSSIYMNNLYTLGLEMPMFNIKSKRNRLGNQYSL